MISKSLLPFHGFSHAPNWSFNQRPLLLISGPPPSWRCSQLQRSRLKGGERFPDFGDLGQDGTPVPKKHVEMVMVHIFWTFVTSCPTTDAFERQFNLQRSLKIICHRCAHHFFPPNPVFSVKGWWFTHVWWAVSIRFSPRPAGLACQKLPFVQWPPPRSGNGERVREEGFWSEACESSGNPLSSGSPRTLQWKGEPTCMTQGCLGPPKNASFEGPMILRVYIYIIILIRIYFFWEVGALSQFVPLSQSNMPVYLSGRQSLGSYFRQSQHPPKLPWNEHLPPQK